jgi:hypothetical protein
MHETSAHMHFMTLTSLHDNHRSAAQYASAQCAAVQRACTTRLNTSSHRAQPFCLYNLQHAALQCIHYMQLQPLHCLCLPVCTLTNYAMHCCSLLHNVDRYLHSGGEGWSANTTCKRVLVTHRDGRQTVEEIQNDIGIDCNDRQAVLDNLTKQGITDVTGIDLYGSADNTTTATASTATAMPVSPTTASKRQAPGGKSNLVLG